MREGRQCNENKHALGMQPVQDQSFSSPVKKRARVMQKTLALDPGEVFPLKVICTGLDGQKFCPGTRQFP